MPSKPLLRVAHTRFIVVFSLALYAVCNGMNLGRLARWFRDGPALDLSALIAYLLAGACLFVAAFTLIAHRFTIKPAAILFLVVSAAATYFIAKYGVAIDSSMIRNVVHTDGVEVAQLMSLRMIPYVVIGVLAPSALILGADITFEPAGRYLVGSLKLFAMALCLALAAIAAEYTAIYRAGNVSNKYIVYSLVPINVISGSVNATARELKPFFRRSGNEAQVVARVTAPGDLLVVLAVGESSRRKSFSLYGYDRRNTNPELQQINGLHLLNAIATRASTLYALPKILEKNGVKLTTLISKAGIPTACFVNYTLYDNCSAVGEIKAHDCGHGGRCYDEDVVPLLKENLATHSPGYRFVVLHFGGGSHGPLYGDRHPPEFRRFEPACTEADVANRCSLEQLYNSYDNTILYVDHVVAQTIRVLDESGVRYVFIYLSDHGESLMEDGRLFHGMPPGIALPAEQAEIPLILKSSAPVTIVDRPNYQQPDVFDSILALFSIDSPGFDQSGAFVREARPE